MRSLLGAVGAVALLGLAAVILLPGCGSSSNEKRIIILTNGNSPFWDAARAGLQDADKKLDLAKDGLKAVVEVNDGTDRGQIDKLRQFATQNDIVAVGGAV